MADSPTRTVADDLARSYQYSLGRTVERFRSMVERLERVGTPTAFALRNSRTPYTSAAADVVCEIRSTIGNLNFDTLIGNAAEVDHAMAKAKALPSVDRLAQIIRTVDGNHNLGAGALAEAIVAELGKGGVTVASDEPTYSSYVRDMRNLSTDDLATKLKRLTTAVERTKAAGWEPNTGTRLTLEAVHEVLAEREAAALETLFGKDPR